MRGKLKIISITAIIATLLMSTTALAGTGYCPSCGNEYGYTSCNGYSHTREFTCYKISNDTYDDIYYYTKLQCYGCGEVRNQYGNHEEREEHDRCCWLGTVYRCPL